MKFRNILQLGFLMTIALFTISGCDKEEGIISMEDYISENNITLTKTTANGVGVVISNAGSAAKPTQNSDVSVIYRGYLTNGNEFDASSNPISFNLQGVIRGWTEGIPEFGKGGSGTLYIPTELAYGNRPPSRNIPAGADLIFDIELVDFQ